MNTCFDVLKSLGACAAALGFVKEMTIEQAIKCVHRGDWILWLYQRLELNHRKLTLAKSRCARTVIHLMTDARSRNAIEVAERYGNNAATEQELSDAADAAYAAYAAYAADDVDDAAAYTADAYAAYTAAAAYAAYTAYTAAAAAAAADDAAAYTADAYAAYTAAAYTAYTAAAAAYVAYTADAYTAAAAHSAARKENQKQTARICVEILGDDIIETVNNLLASMEPRSIKRGN